VAAGSKEGKGVPPIPLEFELDKVHEMQEVGSKLPYCMESHLAPAYRLRKRGGMNGCKLCEVRVWMVDEAVKFGSVDLSRITHGTPRSDESQHIYFYLLTDSDLTSGRRLNGRKQDLVDT
jgi:hypothetical protein